jgi:secondary thiamine-phosphate synthase enzyme
MWRQRLVQLSAKKRGFHLITNELLHSIQSDISDISIGLVHFFLQHTSASLTINENADPDVRADMEDIINCIVPEKNSYRHLDEGADDITAHMKSSLLSCSVTVPISNGRLRLGQWQGIYLGEHRNEGGKRSIVITVQGQSKSKESKDNE